MSAAIKCQPQALAQQHISPEQALNVALLLGRVMAGFDQPDEVGLDAAGSEKVVGWVGHRISLLSGRVNLNESVTNRWSRETWMIFHPRLDKP